MDCGIPFCNNGCPLGNLIPDWNDLVYREHWRDAIDRLHATNNFPEFTGRLCPAPCEAACVLGHQRRPGHHQAGRGRDHRSGVGRGLGRAATARASRPASGSSSIGSGPAGLAAAQQLTRAGHDVVVLERADRIGGLLRYGIPEFKMEKRHLDRRIAQMEAEGTEFRTNATVGDGIDIEVLLASYDAIVLAVRGDRAARSADPGPRAERHPPGDGVPAAVEPGAGGRHRASRRSTSHGKHVVIIGGGDTGADCLGTAHRQGAADVTQLEILPRPPDSRADEQPVAAVEPDLPRLVGPRGGRRARVQRQHRALRRRRRRQRAGAACCTRWRWSTAASRRSREPTASCPPTSCSWRWASSGRSKGRWLDQLGVEFDERGNVARDDQLHDQRARGVRGRRHGPRPEPDRVGDRRGPLCAAGVDAWLMGETQLPSPITHGSRPTERDHSRPVARASA